MNSSILVSCLFVSECRNQPNTIPGGGGHSANAHTGRYVRYFLVRILPKVIFLGPNRTEIMLKIFFTSNIVELIFLGALEAILTSICIV